MAKHPVLNMIKQRVLTNKNWMVLIQGETGVGKSYVALRLGEIIDKNFSVDNVVFTPTEFSKLLEAGTLKPGSVIIFDEAGVGMSSKEWATRSNKLISNITQTFRTNRLIVLFTLPSGRYLDSSIRNIFHALIEPLGVEPGTTKNAFKLLKIEQNYRQNKTYYPYYRFKDSKTGRFYKYAIIRIGKPTDKLCEAYEKKRGSYLSTLQVDLMNWTTTGKKTKFGEGKIVVEKEKKMGVKECIENGLRDWNELLNSKNRISISKLILKYGVSDRVALVAKVGIEQAHQKLYTQT
jgi:hypothetical protein